ncbi:MAG: class I SAM-dependent methyltransferase [Geminicoccaceae bacterium]
MPARSTSIPRPPETPLSSLIRKRIRETGPLSVAAYMDLALNHPTLGYYHGKNPFGADGDFVTAPEISQMFGELIGLWLATAWQQAGSPALFRLVELGPGRGQLMADLLRATTNVPGFLEDADIHLIESSERLRAQQRAKLSGAAVTWHDRLETVPSGPVFLIANEFFDALPVHQLIRIGSGWAERTVTSDGDGDLAFAQGRASPACVGVIEEAPACEPGDMAEISPQREKLAHQIGERIAKDGGVAAIIDYGAFVDHVTGDTLQAVHKHQPVDPLHLPGEADLTTQVDFKSLAQAAASAGADVFGPVPQGTFLRTLGIEVRTATLLQRADQQQSKALRHALFRLTDAGAMGELFKVLVLSAPNSAPPGFEAPTLAAGRLLK